MSYSSLRGVMHYVTDELGPTGREQLNITRHNDGRRILRAQCEMYDRGLMRNVTLVVDDQWRPRSAHVQLQLDNGYHGECHYVFEANRVWLQGQHGGNAPFRESLEQPRPATFGSHSVQNDAWMYGAFDRVRGPSARAALKDVPITSRKPDGSDGPAWHLSRHEHLYLGEEQVQTEAGSFMTRHYEFLLKDRPSIHYWVTGPDYLLVRARWDLLKQSYELVSLERDEDSL